MSPLAQARPARGGVQGVVVRLTPQVPFEAALALRAVREVQQQLADADAAGDPGPGPTDS